MTQQPLPQGWPEEKEKLYCGNCTEDEENRRYYENYFMKGYNLARQDCLIVHNRIVEEKDKRIAELEAIVKQLNQWME